MLVQVSPNAGNHMILFDTVNRGTKEAPAEFNVGAAPANPAADSSFENQGYTPVWMPPQRSRARPTRRSRRPRNSAKVGPIGSDSCRPLASATGLLACGPTVNRTSPQGRSSRRSTTAGRMTGVGADLPLLRRPTNAQDCPFRIPSANTTTGIPVLKLEGG